MGLKGGGTTWAAWKDWKQTVGSVLFWVLKTSLVSSKAIGAMGTSKEAKGEGSVWSYWVDFKKY